MAFDAKRWAVPGAAAAALLAALVYAFWPRPIAVSMAVAARGPMLVTIEDEGETRVKEAYTISAPLAGRVARFEGKVGDRVDAGKTVVATIQPSDPAFHDVRTRSELEAAVKAAEAALDLAKAQVANAQAASDFAAAEHERAVVLAQRGTTSKSALDRARMEARTKGAALAEAKAAVRVRAFQLENARAALLAPVAETGTKPGDKPGGPRCCFEVRAPVSGTILRVYRESEAVVQPGAPLVEIGDPKDLEIVTDLLSTDAVLVSPGDAVLIDGWGGERSLNGRVRRVEPFGFTKVSALGIEEQRVNVIIDFTDPPDAWKRLGHGYRVISRIIRWKGDNVLRVPLSALFRSGEDWALFKVAGGRALRTIVKVGHINTEWAEILGGLAQGDRILLHPGARIDDGTRVTARPER